MGGQANQIMGYCLPYQLAPTGRSIRMEQTSTIEECDPVIFPLMRELLFIIIFFGGGGGIHERVGNNYGTKLTITVCTSMFGQKKDLMIAVQRKRESERERKSIIRKNNRCNVEMSWSG